MAAHEKLSDVQFSYEHIPSSRSGMSFAQHKVTALKGSEEVASMRWSSKGVHWIGVEEPHQRQGIATAMWNEGHRISTERRSVKPRHTADRTDAGDSWARSVGGRLPRRH